ncbi:MAG: zinc ribbon domain-containing protein [Oscillospiraceae bacterium]|nr:zinc ribbon domain-containing protein [Oscillospiraceae bacterium]
MADLLGELEEKINSALAELDGMEAQEARLFEAIGRQAWEQSPGAWPEGAQVETLRQEMAAAREALEALRAVKEKEEEEAKHRCAGCGYRNPDDARFCNQCGKPLPGAAPIPVAAPVEPFCGRCGTKLVPGALFCAECGAKQG